jgi:hypothetical protein
MDSPGTKPKAGDAAETSGQRVTRQQCKCFQHQNVGLSEADKAEGARQDYNHHSSCIPRTRDGR